MKPILCTSTLYVLQADYKNNDKTQALFNILDKILTAKLDYYLPNILRKENIKGLFFKHGIPES